MKHPKTLFIAHWYPSKNRPSTGIFVKNHAQSIALFADLTVVSFEIISGKKIYQRNVSSSHEEGVNTIRIEVMSRFYKLLYYFLPLHYRLLRKALAVHKTSVNEFEIIHSNVLFPSGTVGWHLAKKHRKKLIHTEHWSKLNKFLTQDIHRRKGLKALEFATSITCVSDLLKKELEKYTDAAKISVIPNVVESRYFIRDDKQLSNAKIRFSCMASWDKPKNPFYFLEALKQIYTEQAIPDFEIMMIGDGVQIQEIKDRNYPFSIHYLGHLDSEAIKKHLNQSHLFLHGSDYETFSLVIIEALASGTPVLVSDVGIAREVITPNNGFICENDPKDWKEKILLALKTTYNYSEISEHVGTNYKLENISADFQKIYDSAHR